MNAKLLPNLDLANQTIHELIIDERLSFAQGGVLSLISHASFHTDPLFDGEWSSW